MINKVDIDNNVDKEEVKKINKCLKDALEESEDIINGKIEAKRYKDFDELVKDVD